MKILILNWRDTKHPKSGGAEVVTMEHAIRWAKWNNTVDLFTSGYTGATQQETVERVTIIRRGGWITVYLHAIFFLLLHSRSYDVIIDEIHALPFFSFFVYGKPIVAFIHEIAGEIWDSMLFFPLNNVGKIVEPLLLRIYNMRHIPFWTDANSMVEELVAIGVSRDRCLAIPCPILLPEHIPHVQKRKEFTCIFVSRVVKMKGIEEVIKAFAFIQREISDAELWIVGGGEDAYISELKAMISRLHITKQVIFWGKVNESKKFELMQQSHVFLHASVKEGWGLVVLEAAAMGTPSIVYNVPGLRDVVHHDKTGVVIVNNSPLEMAREVILLKRDIKRYQRYQKAGKEWVDSLSWDEVSKQSLNYLEKAVSHYK